jgi:hypothetical protein
MTVPGGRIALLILLAALTSAAWGHPDLILQIEALDVQLESQPGHSACDRRMQV